MGVAAAVLGASAIGAAATVYGASQASSAQENAANTASSTSLGMYNQTANRLQPFTSAGQTAAGNAANIANQGFSFNPTMSQLEQTPGYQFNLAQGLKSVQSGAAARGLGVSGASMRGAADYASGLASNTYQQQFGNALTSYNTNLQSQMNLASLGENAAAQTGNAGTATAGMVNSNTIGAGNATAAAYMSGANAIGTGTNNALAGYMYASNNGLLGSSGGSSEQNMLNASNPYGNVTSASQFASLA